jgi:hypothetical protein
MFELNILEIISVMAYPNDKKARKKLLANISSKPLGDTQLDKGLREGLEDVFSQMGGISILHDSPEYEKIMEQYSLNTYRGNFAGLILHYIWRIEADSSHSGASVNKAIFLVVECFKDVKNGTTKWKGYPFNEKYIRQAWSDFKPVSHLWAAFVQWDTWGRPSDIAPYDSSGIHGFISLSEKFRTFGLNHFPRAQKASTLPSKGTWFPAKEIDPVPLRYELTPLPLSKKEIQALENYRAPQSL